MRKLRQSVHLSVCLSACDFVIIDLSRLIDLIILCGNLFVQVVGVSGFLLYSLIIISTLLKTVN